MSISMAPRVLIVGATGNLGGALVSAFKKGNEPWEVAGTFRNVNDGLRLHGMGVEPFQADVTDRDSVEALVRKVGNVDAVIMNAGILTGNSRDEFHRVNALGPKNIIEAFGEKDRLPQNFIHESSQLTGGPAAEKQDDEDRYFMGGRDLQISQRSMYAESKAIGERLSCLLYRQHLGTENGWVALRPAGILGPHDLITTKPMVDGFRLMGIGALIGLGLFPNPSRDPEATSFLGKLFTPGQNSKISVVSAKDVAAVTEHLARKNLETPRFGIFDLENGQNGLTGNDIIAAAKDVFGIKKIFNPNWPFFYSAVALGQELMRVFGAKTIIDFTRIEEMSHPSLSTSNTRLIKAYPDLADFDFQTYAEILEDYRSENGLWKWR